MHLLIPLIWWVERTWPTARFPGNTAMTPRREKRAMSRSSAAETREAGRFVELSYLVQESIRRVSRVLRC